MGCGGAPAIFCYGRVGRVAMDEERTLQAARPASAERSLRRRLIRKACRKKPSRSQAGSQHKRPDSPMSATGGKRTRATDGKILRNADAMPFTFLGVACVRLYCSCNPHRRAATRTIGVLLWPIMALVS